MEKFVLVIDEGTTGVRAILFNSKFDIVAQHYEKMNVLYKKGGVVEESASEIFEKSVISFEFSEVIKILTKYRKLF